jgi:hypothetical protein
MWSVTLKTNTSWDSVRKQYAQLVEYFDLGGSNMEVEKIIRLEAS